MFSISFHTFFPCLLKQSFRSNGESFKKVRKLMDGRRHGSDWISFLAVNVSWTGHITFWFAKFNEVLLRSNSLDPSLNYTVPIIFNTNLIYDSRWVKKILINKIELIRKNLNTCTYFSFTTALSLSTLRIHHLSFPTSCSKCM